MSTSVTMSGGTHAPSYPASARLREYFFSDNTRTVQTVLGLIWCLDGGLQFQAAFYTHGFVALLKGGAVGQAPWLHDSIVWAANIAAGNLTVWNSLFALTQCLLGLGLLYRPAVKPALAASIAWACVVWWFGEGLGMVFMDMGQPLTGAPGAIVYALVGILAWPSVKPAGLFSARGARIMWAALWLFMAYLWLLPASSTADAFSQMVQSTPSGIGAVTSVQHSLATALQGDGAWLALVFAALYAAIGIAVAAGWHPRKWLIAAGALNVLIWIIPEAFGSIFTGGATDPNMAPLLVLMAFAMVPSVGGSGSGGLQASAAGMSGDGTAAPGDSRT